MMMVMIKNNDDDEDEDDDFTEEHRSRQSTLCPANCVRLACSRGKCAILE